MHMMRKVKTYYRIKRGSEEPVDDYIQRYKKLARECQNGRELFGNGTRGWHLIGQAGLVEPEEHIVLGTCHTGGYESIE